MPPVVLDASAVLALMFGEPGGERVLPLLPGSKLGAVNAAEVLTKHFERGQSPGEAWGQLSRLQLEIIDLTSDLARSAAQIFTATRHRGLSLGDRACLALAQKLRLPAVTADRRWAGLELGVEIVVIR